MADTDDIEKKEDTETEEDEQSQQAGTKISILTWIIVAAVVVLLAGSGFVLGRLFAGSSSPGITEPPQGNAQKENMTTDGSNTDSDTWYFNDLESVVVNPDEPGATRFVRVGLILEMSAGLSENEAKELIGAQKPLLMNWLNLYFKSLTLEEMADDNDLKRILSQICDAFNETLFPDAEPQIKKILIREFNIQ